MVTAILLGLVPKFGALIVTIPAGVLGGATTVLYGMIAVLGARIGIESRVDFRDSVNLVTAAVAIIVGAANYTLPGATWSSTHRPRVVRGHRHLPGATRARRDADTPADLGEGAIASPAGGVPRRARGREQGG